MVFESGIDGRVSVVRKLCRGGDVKNVRTLPGVFRAAAIGMLCLSMGYSPGIFADSRFDYHKARTALENKKTGSGSATIELNLGLYTSTKPSAMVSKFRPVVSLLEQKMAKKLGKPVKIRMQIAKNYQQGIEHLTAGKVDFSRFGPAPYVEAKTENPELQIVAIESKNRTKVVHGIIATGLHSSIRTIADLKGKSFAFGDQQSTSGRYMSQQFLLKNGIRAKDLSRYEYLGRHDIVGTKVGSGDFAAGAMAESTFRKLLADGEKIRELARFPIVTRPWIARAGIDPRIYLALKVSLLEMTDSSALDRLEINGFVNGSNNDYKVIADSMSENHRFFLGDRRNNVEWVLATRKDKKKNVATIND